jgi:hypothetical protein
MLEAHTHLKDQSAVWSAVVNWLGGFDSRVGNPEELDDDGRKVPEQTIGEIRDWIHQEKVAPLQKKIEDFERSTVEVKDAEEGSKQVGSKARGRRNRKEAPGK